MAELVGARGNDVCPPGAFVFPETRPTDRPTDRPPPFWPADFIPLKRDGFDFPPLRGIDFEI